MFRVLRRLRKCPRVRLCSIDVVRKDELIKKLQKSFINDKESNFVVPAFKKALLFPDEIAVKDCNGEFTYLQLFLTAKRLATQISNICGSASLSNVAFLSPNNVLWIAMQWSCWISGQVAIPLESTQCLEQLRRQASDCKPKLLIATLDCERIAKDLSNIFEIATVVLDHTFIPSLESVTPQSIYIAQLVCAQDSILLESIIANDFYGWAPAMLLYTPNAVGCPKRVLLTHRNIEEQQNCLITSLRLEKGDCMLPIMPMNRMHAVIGSLLSVGGNISLQNMCDCHNAWSSLLGINSPSKKRINLFLAMPIVYKRLISKYDKLFAKDSRMVEYIVNHCKNKIRLMFTAFALLPDSVFYRWREITAQNIYEYYGTLETGLVIGHSIGGDSLTHGVTRCRPGILGGPLKDVTARLINSQGKELVRRTSYQHGAIHLDFETNKPSDLQSMNTIIGELEIKKDISTVEARKPAMLSILPKKVDTLVTTLQPTVSLPARDSVSDITLSATLSFANGASLPLSNVVTAGLFIPVIGVPQTEAEVVPSLDKDGFFKTGDTCAYHNENFYFLSKTKDVFKVGGYKIYGSDIKRVLISHPNINNVAVVGIPNKIWGCRLGVICIVLSDSDRDLDAIKRFCCHNLAVHKCPTVFKTIASKWTQAQQNYEK